MIAKVASTALLRVIVSKSPRDDPRYSNIWSPHQSKSFSKGMMEMKHTGRLWSAPISTTTVATHIQKLSFRPSG